MYVNGYGTFICNRNKITFIAVVLLDFSVKTLKKTVEFSSKTFPPWATAFVELIKLSGSKIKSKIPLVFVGITT